MFAISRNSSACQNGKPSMCSFSTFPSVFLLLLPRHLNPTADALFIARDFFSPWQLWNDKFDRGAKTFNRFHYGFWLSHPPFLHHDWAPIFRHLLHFRLPKPGNPTVPQFHFKISLVNNAFHNPLGGSYAFYGSYTNFQKWHSLHRHFPADFPSEERDEIDSEIMTGCVSAKSSGEFSPRVSEKKIERVPLMIRSFFYDAIMDVMKTNDFWRESRKLF